MTFRFLSSFKRCSFKMSSERRNFTKDFQRCDCGSSYTKQSHSNCKSSSSSSSSSSPASPSYNHTFHYTEHCPFLLVSHRRSFSSPTTDLPHKSHSPFIDSLVSLLSHTNSYFTLCFAQEREFASSKVCFSSRSTSSWNK
jgi:hypothetical protein